MRVVVLGAGFGGLEVTASVSAALGADADITLIDRTEAFVFGFAKLDVMFGHEDERAVRHRYSDIVKPGVQFLQADVRAIDPATRVVHTDAGTVEADVLVLALGADLEPSATPGLVEAGHEFYTEAGAFALRQTLLDFPGGDVVIGLHSTPFKCPPAPSECALLTHDLLTRTGVRTASTVTLVMPFGVPVPPAPDASEALLAAFAEHGIGWVPDQLVTRLDAGRRVVVLSDGRELACDLFLGVPKHVAPRVVVDAGLTDDGWIPVDPLTLRTRFDGVYAVGDVTSVGTPKAGVFAEGQAAVVAQAIIAQARGAASEQTYDGHAICYVEFGAGQVAEIDMTFPAEGHPHGSMLGPSHDLHHNKSEFGASRIRRWFS